MLNIVGKIIKTIGITMGCLPEYHRVSACGHKSLKTGLANCVSREVYGR
jgi:hypothetical protein